MTTDAVDAEFRPLAVREAAPPAPQLLDALRPAERVALMAEMSGVIKDVIEKQKWFTMISGRKHIKIEGWTFVGGLGGCSAKTTHVDPIEGGWKAHAVVVRVDSGIEVGSAEQVCMSSEANWRGKPDQALIGMSSTRACSRALSTVFRHVVELAGYSATPAEEMNKDDKALPTTDPFQPVSVRVPLDELLDLARPHGIADAKAFGAWCVREGIAPDLLERQRKVLTHDETVAAKKLLLEWTAREASVKADAPKYAERPKVDDTAKMTPRSQGRLFALLDERLSTEKEARLIFAAEHGIVVDSFSQLSELEARTLIRQLEMIPPPPDEDPRDADDLLTLYAEGKLFT